MRTLVEVDARPIATEEVLHQLFEFIVEEKIDFNLSALYIKDTCPPMREGYASCEKIARLIKKLVCGEASDIIKTRGAEEKFCGIVFKLHDFLAEKISRINDSNRSVFRQSLNEFIRKDNGQNPSYSKHMLMLNSCSSFIRSNNKGLLMSMIRKYLLEMNREDIQRPHRSNNRKRVKGFGLRHAAGELDLQPSAKKVVANFHTYTSEDNNLRRLIKDVDTTLRKRTLEGGGNLLKRLRATSKASECGDERTVDPGEYVTESVPCFNPFSEDPSERSLGLFSECARECSSERFLGIPLGTPPGMLRKLFPKAFQSSIELCP